jgi:hypothetical protein
MSLTEMEYQPRAQNEGTIGTMMAHWYRGSKNDGRVRSRDAVLIDLHEI